MTQNLRSYASPAGDIATARKLDSGEWRIVAHANDENITQTSTFATFDEAGFRGRQWTLAVDGQQYPSLRAAVEATMADAVRWGKNHSCKHEVNSDCPHYS